jgi:4-aminobutyrate aminotransferase
MGLPVATSEEEIVSKSLHQLELLLQQQSAPSDTAAIIIEPVLGEGGYIHAPPAYLRGLREIAHKHNILLIFDEVQCGFGRTGKMFFSEYSGVKPDIMVVAKGIANGFPLSGIVSRKEIMDSQAPGTIVRPLSYGIWLGAAALTRSVSQGGTYAGNAVACAAASAVADAFQEENILENVQARSVFISDYTRSHLIVAARDSRSKELFASLEELRSDPVVNPFILDVRGVGLMVGVEFTSPTPANDPFARPHHLPGLALAITKKCQENGLFILTTSVFQVRSVPQLARPYHTLIACDT